MQKRRVLSLILAVLLFLTTSPMDVRAAGGSAWEWENENNYEGWSHNNQIDATCVADGWYTLHIPGTEDPNITSPTISIDASTYKTLEITYRNQTGNSNARLYWRGSSEGFSESKAVNFMTFADGEVHTFQINLAQQSGWTGTIAQIRIDPTTGGNGNFGIDSLRFTTAAKPEGKLSQEWQWTTANDTLGWTTNEQVNRSSVENGRYVLYLANKNDPNLLSPAIRVDASTYQYFEITYKNETGNSDAKLYWTREDAGFAEARAMSIPTITDGKWHTLRVDLSASGEWRGTITQLRFDPTTGGAGNFEIDRLALLDKPCRYTLHNGYFYLSGATGLIDTLRFDPNGASNYSEDLINGNLFLAFDYNGTPYSGTSADVEWTISGNTLQIRNIQFASSGLSGIWTIELDGNQLHSSFEIMSYGNNKQLKNTGYVMDMLWENNGYDVEATPAGALKVPFSKMVASSDRYHSAYAFKRMSREDTETLGLDGDWIDWEGANGFDFNLRFIPDTKYISPLCSVDNLRLYFRNPNAETITIQNGESFTRTLTIQLSQSTDATPEHFARYGSENSTVSTALNEMMYEFGYAREASSTNPDWWEWVSLTRAWRNDHYLTPDLNSTTNVSQNADGYIWTWAGSQGWPFPTDRDSNHYLMTTANYINAVYNYFMYNGDLAYLRANIRKMRLGMQYLLNQYDAQAKLFIIDHPDHNGTNTSIGSNYWDITPYGYKSAYDNIYCYLALNRMAEIEQMLGNTARASELAGYASDLKSGYNAAFWTGNHYVQVIDAYGTAHDYGCVYLNLEALNYGLANKTQAVAIMDFLSNTKTSSGSADTFTAFQFAPRVTMFNNVHNSEGGWYVAIYNSSGIFGTDQLQNGGANFYTMYYELMCRIKAYGADNAYRRLETLVNRFNIEHMQGGNQLYYGEKNQHGGEGNVGIWGEFPESGLVPVAAKDGFMGISADKDGLHITPNLPSSDMTTLSLSNIDYWGMKLNISVSATSVRIYAVENNSPYTDWSVNGTAVSGSFDIIVPIQAGESVTLSRATNTYDLSMG